MNIDDEVTLAPVPEPERPWEIHIYYRTSTAIVLYSEEIQKTPHGMSIFLRKIQQNGLFLNKEKTDWVPFHCILRVWLEK